MNFTSDIEMVILLSCREEIAMTLPAISLIVKLQISVSSHHIQDLQSWISLMPEILIHMHKNWIS